jgi:DNA-binding transcriptional LysR family regulator
MAHIRVRESFGLKPEGSVARRGRKQRGEARYPRAIEPRCLKVALPAFMTTYPELEIELSSTDRQVDPVQEGFDCVLRIGPIGDDALIARPLGRLRMVNVASSAYLARVGVPLSVEDLMTQNHRTIHYSRTFSARPYGWKYPDAGGYATLPLRGALHVNSVQTYEATGLAGLGLIQARSSACASIWKAARWSRYFPITGPSHSTSPSWSRTKVTFRAGFGPSSPGRKRLCRLIWSELLRYRLPAASLGPRRWHP